MGEETKPHLFHARLEWTEGDEGTTLEYEAYTRSHTLKCPGKAGIAMSSAPQYLGNPERFNPEELFTMAISSCQMLTYLALASFAKIRVLAYTDEAEGTLMKKDKKMQITRVLLRPKVLVPAGTDTEKALSLIEKAHAQCFIANSVTAEIINRPEIVTV